MQNGVIHVINYILPLKLHSIDEENNTAIIAVNVKDVGQMGISHIVNKYNLFLQISIEEITGYHLTLNFVNSSDLYSEDSLRLLCKVPAG